MPTQTPASFASAAAANGSNEGSTSGRGLGGATDWTRSRANGATHTFRRPSQASTSTSTQRDGTQQNNATSASGVYVPPHLNSNYSSFSRQSGNMDSRYSKDQLLDLYRSHSRGSYGENLPSLLTEGWIPGATNAKSNGGWSRREETRDGQFGADICWDSTGQVQPLGLVSMGEEEKDLFSTSVNSPLKPPPQNPAKDNTSTQGPNGRKLSMSQTPNASGSHSTAGQSSRPGTRRRDTNDSMNNPLASPSPFNRSSRDDNLPPASLIRRKTDAKEGGSGSFFGERPKLDTALDTDSPFNNLKRTTTGPMSAGLNGPSSPWGSTPQSAGFGAFGNFSLEGGSAQPTTPGEKKLGFGSLRGESRFKGLMSKDSAEDMAAKQKDKPVSGLEKLCQSDIERQSSKWGQARLNKSVSKDSDDFAEPATVGSAALGGDDPSPPLHSRSSNLDKQRTHNEIGFTSFGTQGENPSFGKSTSRRDLGVQETPSSQRYSGGNAFEPMSPTNTNPYQSPEADRTDEPHDNADNKVQSPYGLQGNLQKSHPASFEGVDRSQTSSTGAQRSFPALGGLGGIGGLSGAGPWSAAPGAVGTPGKTTPGFPSAFGESLFGPMGDHNSPGGMFGAPASNAFGGVGRSRMGSLFPAQMQDQMRMGDGSKGEQSFGDAGVGRNAPAPGMGMPSRETESPVHPSRGVLDDLFGNIDRSRVSGASPFTSHEGGQGAVNNRGNVQSSLQQPFTTASSIAPAPAAHPSSNNGSFFGRSPESDGGAGGSNQIPPAQQRQMVMPDRMRWVYRDPQGIEQGPFSGLEMHDWYKAGFFSPELQVKKIEDNEHEPLAQLIRRIGNSREPFLVPQIGIPHGPANTQGASGGSGILGAPTSSNNAQSGSAQPPFANSFPSFGTTLTADQQNALERRKQEEQYLMARQKEHLVQHQLMQRNHPHPGMPHPMHPQLQHHSSAHSLQSQPSYGSITSPSGYQPSPIQMPPAPGGMPGFFDSQQRPGMGNISFPSEGAFLGRDNEVTNSMDRLKLGRNVQPTYGNIPSQGQPEGLSHQQQVASMMQDRTRLQREQEHYDALQRGGLGSGKQSLERFEQFQQLRAQEDEQSLPPGGVIGQSRTKEPVDKHMANDGQPTYEASLESSPPPSSQDDQGVKLEAQPVQRVAPPPPSLSPLPAPAAQRNRQHVADNLVAESGSRSQTPSADTPTATLAPWAKENADGPKGPSLKEIQETEARKTAQQEEIAAAARRANAEQERLAASQIVPPAPGLPSTANWATGSSPVNASGGPSAWTKPLAGKAVTPNTTKKTLAQIQKEEEARKNRAAAAAMAATNSSNVSSPAIAPSGKRYADLAGKVAFPNPMAGGGAWTTVGAGGKAKAPTGPAPIPIPAQRAASGGQAAAPNATPKAKSAVPLRSNAAAGQSAQDEFQKWVKGALSKGLNAGINVDDFVRNLLQLPIDAEVLSEAIYANSETLDGHRFAEEFIRRRKLADKGVAPEASSSANFSSGVGESKSSGGWSEVAKKVPSNAPKEDTSSSFKVVAAKKKGKR